MPETPAPYDADPNPQGRLRVERIVATYEALMHRVASAHAPEFLGVGVTMSQAKVLYLVEADAGLRMSVLSARLGVSLSTISGVVDRLVDQGLLDRRDDPADRRQVVLRITPAGVTQLERFRELSSGQVRALLAGMDEPDLNVVEKALDILAEAALRPASSRASQAPATEGEPA